MGYRLEVSEITYKACGDKLFGYVKDVTELKSHQWLLAKGFIDGDEYWGYGCNPQIILDSGEFREFVKLYMEDNGYENEELVELAKTNENKLLEWW